MEVLASSEDNADKEKKSQRRAGLAQQKKLPATSSMSAKVATPHPTGRTAAAASTRTSSRSTRSSAVVPTPSPEPYERIGSQDVPAFAAFAGPAVSSRTSPNKPAPAVRARPVAKKKVVLSPEEQERLRKQQRQEAEQDDFFTTKATITFKTRSGVSQQCE